MHSLQGVGRDQDVCGGQAGLVRIASAPSPQVPGQGDEASEEQAAQRANETGREKLKGRAQGEDQAEAGTSDIIFLVSDTKR